MSSDSIWPVADDLIPVLTRFHREVLLPDLKRIVGEAVGELRAEINTHSTRSTSASTGSKPRGASTRSRLTGSPVAA